MIDEERGVTAKLKQQPDSKNKLNIEFISHQLALSCADTGNGLEFALNFNPTMIQW